MAANDIGEAVAAEVRRLITAGAPEAESTIQQAIKNVAGSKSGIFARIGDLVSGFPADTMRNIKMALLAAIIGVEAENLIQRAVTERRLDLDPIPPWLEPLLSAAMKGGEEAIGAPIFDLLINDPLGLGLKATGGGSEAAAVKMTQRLFGMGAAVDFGTAQLEDILMAAMGGNAPKGLTKAVQNIPWTVGASWATGFFLSQIMNSAAMPSINEKINEQFRPARLTESSILSLVRMGKLEPSDAYPLLASMGYSDDRIVQLFWLDKSPMTMGDLQQAYLAGLMSEADVRKGMSTLGFTEDAQDLMWTLYMVKSETQGGDQLRAVAQRAYLDDHITEDVYRGYLERVNVPQLSIDLDIEAVNLAKELQRKMLSVTQLRELYLAGHISHDAAIAQLIQQHYTPDDAQQVVMTWETVAKAPRSGFSEARILAYAASGVLTQAEAYDKLVANGIRAEDAAFLAAHPTASPGVKSHGATTATVLGALRDGIIDIPTAEAKLVARGMAQEDAVLTVREAGAKLNRPKPHAAVVKSLSEAQIIDAFKQGLATSAWATRELVASGYNEPSAQLIVAIEETKLAGAIPADWVQLT